MYDAFIPFRVQKYNRKATYTIFYYFSPNIISHNSRMAPSPPQRVKCIISGSFLTTCIALTGQAGVPPRVSQFAVQRVAIFENIHKIAQIGNGESPSGLLCQFDTVIAPCPRYAQ